MILIINGSFGVGKTTVARLLRKQITGSRLYDPEWAGLILRRFPAKIGFNGSGTDDFQDMELWRKSVIHGTRLFQGLAKNTVIVPMAFSRRDYFDEIISGMRKFDDRIKVFCLKAEMPTILGRLKQRGEKIGSKGGDSSSSWVVRKAQECVNAHRDSHFGESIDTEGVSASEVAAEILRRLENTKRV